MTNAFRTQLEERDGLIATGARRVGWKLGIGDAERTGSDPAVGYLTSATQLSSGDAFHARAPLHADVEIGVEFAADVEPDGDLPIAGYRPVLELVDLNSAYASPDQIVATNIFHRAFALGPLRPSRPDAIEARLVVDGSVRGSAHAHDLTDRLRAAARVVATAGERFRAGDVVITGSIVQAPVDDASEVTADLGALGSVTLRLGD